jgi:hypothetical protein
MNVLDNYKEDLLNLGDPFEIDDDTYFCKFNYNNMPFMVKTNKICIFKKIKKNKDNYVNISITSKDYLVWFETFYTWCVQTFHERSEDWFEEPLTLSDVEFSFINPLKSNIKDNCFDIQCSTDENRLHIVDTEDNVNSLDSLKDCNIIPTFHIKGVKFNNKHFSLDIEVNNILVILEDLDTENMLAKNLSAFIVADILEKAGVKVRIYGLRTYVDNREILSSGKIVDEDQAVFIAYAIKEYGEQIDFGRLASFTSDKRFFRVNLWRIASTLRKKETGDYRKGKAYSLYGGEDDLYNAFAMFKNWVFNKKGTVQFDTKINDKNLMVLSGLPTVNKNDKLTGVNTDRTFRKIQKEVYRTLDYVGMLLTKNPKAFVGKIYKREKDTPTQVQYYSDVKKEVREYLEGLITTNLTIVPQYDLTDRDSADNRFSTPLNEVPRITERTNELIDVINNVIV